MKNSFLTSVIDNYFIFSISSLEGRFIRPRFICDNNPLTIDKCQWHRNEVAELKQLTSFKHSDIIAVKNNLKATRENATLAVLKIPIEETQVADDWDLQPVVTSDTTLTAGIHFDQTQVPSQQFTTADELILDPTGDFEIEMIEEVEEEEVLTQAQTLPFFPSPQHNDNSNNNNSSNCNNNNCNNDDNNNSNNNGNRNNNSSNNNNDNRNYNNSNNDNNNNNNNNGNNSMLNWFINKVHTQHNSAIH